MTIGRNLFVSQVLGSDTKGNGLFQSPFLTIQKAIDTSLNGDTIWVGNGIYTAYSGQPKTTPILKVEKMIKVISLYGPENCIIDGQNTTTDGYGGAYLNVGQVFGTETICPVIEGFTFQNCYAPVNSYNNPFGNGSGVFIGQNQESGPPQINGTGKVRNCIFDNCKSNNTGGAIYLETLTLGGVEDCIIKNCIASQGGGIFARYTYVPKTFVRNVLIHNCSCTYIAGAIAAKEGIRASHITMTGNTDNVGAGFGLFAGGIFFNTTAPNRDHITDSVVAGNVLAEWRSYPGAASSINWSYSLTNTSAIPSAPNMINSVANPPVFTADYQLDSTSPGYNSASDGKSMGWLGLPTPTFPPVPFYRSNVTNREQDILEQERSEGKIAIHTSEGVTRYIPIGAFNRKTYAGVLKSWGDKF